MATYYELTRSAPWHNPYYCYYELNKICFYDATKGEVVATVEKGWLGDNNNGSKLETLEYRRKIKVDLKSKESFVVKHTLYVEINQLGGFTLTGASVWRQDEFEATWIDQFEIDGVSYEYGLTRCVKTPLGVLAAKARELLDYRVTPLDIERLIKDKQRLNQLTKLLATIQEQAQ